MNVGLVGIYEGGNMPRRVKKGEACFGGMDWSVSIRRVHPFCNFVHSVSCDSMSLSV